MQKKYVCIKYVHSRVTVYHNCKIDIRWKRAIHNCVLCDSLPFKKLGSKCNCIHYGFCTTVSVPVPSVQSENKPINGSPTVNVVSPARKKALVAPPHGKRTPVNIAVKVAPPVRIPVAVIPVSPVVPVKPQAPLVSPQSVHIVVKDQEKDGVQERKDREKVGEKDSQHKLIPTSSKINNETKIRELPTPRKQPTATPSVSIPRFYFPQGRPDHPQGTDPVLQRAVTEFSKVEGGKVHKDKMGAITKACGLPFYWKCLLFRAAGGTENGFITLQSFTSMWKRVCEKNHDTTSRFFHLLSQPDRKYLLHSDFEPLIQDIIETHPGLTFLLEAPEFHSRYVNTVISRIYFCANRSWSGKLTLNELRRCNFLQTLERLEDEDDINQITDYFSYEHFYVIYCKFWELDKDHDLYIDMNDLLRHNDHALSVKVIDRIFSGAVSRGSTFQDGRMSYTEFVWFLIAEEDKKHPTSIEYWFRCMDLDGDGVISMFEMEQFYQEQMQKMEEVGIEKLPFEDCLCQMLDLVRPEIKDKITLKDIKNCKMADIFFDTFFNLDKFLDHEQRDPFANIRDPDCDGPEPTAWEKYAAEEYEILVVEEGANDQDLEEINYEDDFECEDDEYEDQDVIRGVVRVDDKNKRKADPRSKVVPADDIYDFSTSNLGY